MVTRFLALSFVMVYASSISAAETNKNQANNALSKVIDLTKIPRKAKKASTLEYDPLYRPDNWYNAPYRSSMRSFYGTDSATGNWLHPNRHNPFDEYPYN